MNIVLDIPQYNIFNLFFLEKKQNIIMDGTFTKFIYSNQHFILNSLYLYFPIEIKYLEKTPIKNTIRFHPTCDKNIQLINELSKIEFHIIEYYKSLYQCTKATICLLSKQLYNGSLKVYSESHPSSFSKNYTTNYIIKISGVWETHDEVGITYKLIECYS